jgi:TolB protein
MALAVSLSAQVPTIASDGAVQLTFGPSQECAPAWSPNGDQIAFESEADGNWDIWLIDAAGSTPTIVTVDPSSDRRPTWSPDGSHIAFDSDRSGGLDIWCVMPAGGGAERITSSSACANPTWSFHGARWTRGDFRWIAFEYASGDCDGINHEIRSVPFSGGSPTQITPTCLLANAPAWSPRGNQLAYHNWGRDGWHRGIWVRDLDGDEVVQITSEYPDRDDNPAWSPDASHIAFQSDRSGDWEIWLIPSGGGVATRVTNGGGTEPTWSPDGSHIAFASDRSGNSDIWVIDVTKPVTINQESWGSIKARYRP